MRARDIIGRTVERVEQVRRSTNCDTTVYSVEYIHFTDGSYIGLHVAELEADYAVECTYFKANKP